MKLTLLISLLFACISAPAQNTVTADELVGEWLVASYQIDMKTENPIWMEEIIKSRERFRFVFFEDGTIELKNTAIESGKGSWVIDGISLTIEYDNAVEHILWEGAIAAWNNLLTFELRHDDWQESFTLRRL